LRAPPVCEAARRPEVRDVNVADAEIGGVEVLLEHLHDLGRSYGSGVSDRVEDATVSLCHGNPQWRERSCRTGRSIGAEVERVRLEQVILQRGVADVVEVSLAGLALALA